MMLTSMGGGVALPNVSYCVTEGDVHYNPYVHDYSKDYFTTVALENGTISFNIWRDMGTDTITSISYSTDNGNTWVITENQDNKSSNIIITVNVNEGDSVLWKGIALKLCQYDNYYNSFFTSTARFNVEGNVMSLCYGDSFLDKDELEYTAQFAYLFGDYYTATSNALVISAENLSLPATTLTDYCYGSMFGNCTSLTTAPELPATTLAQACYTSMFGGCTSLTTAPELPATTLTESCYGSMFYGCTSLVTAPELPATTLTDYCYGSMFGNCTSLTTAPELPATTLASRCYISMFKGCTSLTTAPVLSATTLTDYCYSSMFWSCTSLVTAPELPATTLAQRCYSNMFNGCTNLNHIKAMFTTTPSTSYTQNWVSGVAPSGTFVKNSAAQWNVSGANGIPTGWTVETVSV